MAKTKTISNPATIFRLFANAYRTLDPSIGISAESSTRVDGIIDDICKGREIAAFKVASRSSFLLKARQRRSRRAPASSSIFWVCCTMR